MLEALKARYNRGAASGLYFFRDSHGNEIDLLHKSGRHLTGVEIKAAATWNRSFKQALNRFSERLHPLDRRYVVYSGEAIAFSDGVEALPFPRTGELFGE